MSREFGKRLTEIMKERGLSVRDAASTCGVAASTLQNWRGGASPKEFGALQKLADYLDTSLSYLLTGRDDKLAATLNDVVVDGGIVFDGVAQITIRRLLPKSGVGK